MDFPFEREFFGRKNPLYGKNEKNIMKTDVCSYLYPYELFLAAAVSAVFILIPAYFVRRDADRIRREKLAALEK